MTLDQLVTVQRKSQIQQADGSLQTTMVEVARCFARVLPIRGSERDESSQTQSSAAYRFYIHYRSDLDEDDVIVWRGKQHNIRFIADTGDGSIYLMIEAERGVAV